MVNEVPKLSEPLHAPENIREILPMKPNTTDEIETSQFENIEKRNSQTQVYSSDQSHTLSSKASAEHESSPSKIIEVTNQPIENSLVKSSK